ncbi:hypothetical protein [Cupriavidus gilardii]|uniref:hypothetical protein n=1 Tax=Cupriavidus gilardii TaxID=82541 RepID=UPI0021BE9009|nr:hypothetical protein [Cupriavidus gilardii]MCT9127482.1 hypothetical protein [Cupriavidus gilardii]
MEAALRTIAEWPVTPAGNMDAENMRRVAGSALAAATAPGAPGREAEHPAAQAAGLTDEGIIGIAELDGVATYETGWYRMTRGGLLAFARALLSRAEREAAGLRQMLDAERQRAANAVAVSNALQDKLSRAAPQSSEQQADPCPGCVPGGVCKTPTCGRLQARNAAQQAEQPTEGARGVDGDLMEAIRRYAFLFALHTQNNTDASRADADAALARIRALLAAPAAGTGHGKPFGWASASNGNYFTRSERIAKRIGGLVPVYTAPQAATGAQGLIALLREARGVVEQQWDESNTAADHDLLQRIDAALAQAAPSAAVPMACPHQDRSDCAMFGVSLHAESAKENAESLQRGDAALAASKEA